MIQIVEVIKAEIERRLNEYKEFAFDEYTYQTDSNVMELKELLSFIDSLEQDGDLAKVLDKDYKQSDLGKSEVIKQKISHPLQRTW